MCHNFQNKIVLAIVRYEKIIAKVYNRPTLSQKQLNKFSQNDNFKNIFIKGTGT